MTLTGTSSDYFVLVVSGGMSLSGSSGLLVGGGVTANHVIYDFTGTDTGVHAVSTCGSNNPGSGTVNYQICTNTGNTVYGTLIAPNLAYLLDAPITGEVIGGQEIYLQSNGDITQDSFTPYNPGPATPEPSSILLLGTGLSAAGVLRKRLMQKIVG